jgi:hypothetical protein
MRAENSSISKAVRHLQQLRPSEAEKLRLDELVTQRMGLATGTAEAKALEQAIDAVVFGLYGLTDGEVGVVG